MSDIEPAERARAAPRAGDTMAWIPGGTFLMGSDAHYPEEAPAHRVTVSGFWIDRHTVTNADLGVNPTPLTYKFP